MTESSPAEKIYLTYKTRMTTEARLRKAALTYHILLSWYSFCLIIVSIVGVSESFALAHSDIISVAVSVMIFGLSLFLYGERYSERADRIKSCYLELKKLYECDLGIDTKMRRYAEILERYENQSDRDYDEMVFDAYLRSQTLKNAYGTVEPTLVVIAKVSFWRMLRAIGTTALFLFPVVAGFLWITPTGIK